jgi:hypothetical protein
MNDTHENCIRKNDYSIITCRFSDIKHIFEKYHYKGNHMGGGISQCYALIDKNNNIVGGSVLGKPRHEKKYKNCIDIRRMALLDSVPQNAETFFMGKIIKHIRDTTQYDYVLSYADATVGHAGTIYKAANFKEIGKTSPTLHVFWNGVRYHPRSLSIDRPYSYRLRDAIKNGEAYKELGLPKTIYLFTIIRKKYKKPTCHT